MIQLDLKNTIFFLNLKLVVRVKTKENNDKSKSIKRVKWEWLRGRIFFSP